MKPYYQGDLVTLYLGDCIEVMHTFGDGSIDAIVTDPPYGLGFMGKEWDSTAALASRPPSADEIDARFSFKYPRTGKGPAAVAFDGRAFQAWCEKWAAEAMRVLKPGGHLLAFGGSRTWHRLACAIEDAGFEIRDSIAWLYGQGFPKSLDVSKAIDKAAGATREIIGTYQGATNIGTIADGKRGYGPDGADTSGVDRTVNITGPATPDAEKWQGWGTALKPAFEPIVVARKPLVGTVAANVLAHGTGALNIDATRVAMSDRDRAVIDNMGGFGSVGWAPSDEAQAAGVLEGRVDGSLASLGAKAHDKGRWPTNVLLDGDTADSLDAQSGTSRSTIGKPRASAQPGEGYGMTATGAEYADTGGASRFFPTFRYEAKAPTAERPRDGTTAHPTVKPLDLMRWLVRLVTPRSGIVLDPFAGSGTTGEACIIEGFRSILIERESAYLPLIMARINKPIEPVLDFDAA